MKTFIAAMAQHCLAAGKSHSALADYYRSGGDEDCAKLHDDLAMGHLNMAQSCVDYSKSMEAEIKKVRAGDGDLQPVDFSIFTKIEG
jgi:hypothetical protein